MENHLKLNFCFYIKFLGIAAILTVFIFVHSLAQNSYSFKEGLVAGESHEYGRQALYKDFLAARLYSGELRAEVGQSAFQNEKGETVKWKAVAVGEANKFKDRSLINGYLYLKYESHREQNALLRITSNSMVYVNGAPRAGDLYGYGYLYLPVKLKKGVNDFFVRGSRFSFYEGISASLIFQDKKVFINKEDPTLPMAVVGAGNSRLRGAVVVVNSSEQVLKGLKIISKVYGKEISVLLPAIPAMSIRKVAFGFDASMVTSKGNFNCELSLMQGATLLDKQMLKVEAVNNGEDYNETFVSEIDGSTQYYSVSPQKNGWKSNSSLFLSVHGAGVEAINQTRAYKSKEEGTLVSPTNRRPRGFNWEDWGRIDALEVLDIAKKEFKPDPQRVYLTGHSMGGHGTWYLGATYPGKWAAIAPCAGYPTLASYGSADGKIPDTVGKPEAESILLQASNPSNIFELAKNYNAGGIYIHHGDSDKVVSVDYARQMHKLLAGFHKDVSYYEYPGGSHWFGDESVDWKPIFDYFKWHTIPKDTSVKQIDFSTANPAVSSSYHWASIIQQREPLKYSRINLSRSPDLKSVQGKTENVSILAFSLSGMKSGDKLLVKLDDADQISYSVRGSDDKIYLQKNNKQWLIVDKPDERLKGEVRNGTFKEPFNNRMVFVYGTRGNEEENAWAYNKARYDAESWYYRGNGAVDIVADKAFDPAAYLNRGIIIFGNATTNSAYIKLLKDCPIQVKRGRLTVGNKVYKGDDLSAYFMWPRSDSKKSSIAVISGTGLSGMQATDANQYFAGGSGFPDYMIFTADLLKKGSSSIKYTGYYGNDWSLEKGQRLVVD